MSNAQIFHVGSFDVANYSEAELWAKMHQLARFYATLTDHFRLLAYSRPYPLTEPLERIKEMMASAPDARTRNQIAAYRRFIEQIVQAAYLKDTNYYIAAFSDQQAHLLTNILASGLRLPVEHIPQLPDILPEEYDIYRDHIAPVSRKNSRLQGRNTNPYLSFLYSYDLRGQLNLATTIHFLQLPFPLHLAIDVKTIHPTKAIGTLQRAYNKLRADLASRGGNEAPDPEKEQAFRDVQEAMQQATDNRMGIHQITLGFAIEGDTYRELQERIELLQATAERNQIYLRPAWWQQKDTYTTFFTPQLPSGLIAGAARNVDSRGMACLTPFGYQVRKDTQGPFVAINRATGSPLWLDKFGLPAYNEVVIGRTGSGKTFMTGLRAYRAIPFGVQSIIIDPQRNFRGLTEAAGGKYNFLRLGAGTALNILDIVHNHPGAQISHVIVMLQALLGRNLNLPEKAAVDVSLVELYKHRLQNDEDETKAEHMPLLQDLAVILRGRNGNGPAPGLANDLARFVDGSLKEIFNAHTTLSFNLDRRWPIITFDVHDLEDEFQPTLIYALLSGIERAIRNRKGEQKPTNIILDEFFILSQIPTLARAAGVLAKRVRAWKVGIQCIDQNWNTFDTAAGRQILENTLVKTIMLVDDTAAPPIVDALGLTGHHAEIILSADQGEGVFIIENKPYHVFFQASADEVSMLTPYAPPIQEGIELPTRQ